MAELVIDMDIAEESFAIDCDIQESDGSIDASLGYDVTQTISQEVDWEDITNKPEALCGKVLNVSNTLPDYSSAANGSVLKIVNGVPTWTTA